MKTSGKTNKKNGPSEAHEPKSHTKIVQSKKETTKNVGSLASKKTVEKTNSPYAIKKTVITDSKLKDENRPFNNERVTNYGESEHYTAASGTNQNYAQNEYEDYELSEDNYSVQEDENKDYDFNDEEDEDRAFRI